MSFEQSGRFHRQPIGFGPAATPRQDKNGDRFSWAKSSLTLAGIVVEASVASVQPLLPEGYRVEVDGDTTTVLFESMELRNLPWLAGRGYNTFGIYLNNIVCDRVSPSTKPASYLAVLFESFCDPIVTGREELGFPKVWAEMPDGKLEKDGTGLKRTHTVSWLGFEFLRLELSGLKECDANLAPEITKKQYRDFTHPMQDGIIHHRYMPAVGEPGKHDASYATFCPAPAGLPTVLHYYAPYAAAGSPSYPTSQDDDASISGTSVRLEIKRGTFEQLPTLHNIVDGLASLELGKVKECAVQEIKHADDLKRNCRIEH